MITMFDWIYYDLPAEERYRLMRRTGFGGVTLWWGDAFKGAAAPARAAGLCIENVHGPYVGNSNFWLDNAEGEAITEYHLKCVADCAAFEIPTMVVHLIGDTCPPANDLGVERIKRLAEAAERHGVNLALENLYAIEHLVYALDRVDSPRIGFCYDSGHQNCHTPDADLLTRYGTRLMTLHLHDNEGVGAEGEKDQHLLPFDGTTDWAGIMRKIADSGFAGAVGLEAANFGYEDLSAEDFYRVAFERGQKLAALMGR